MAGEFAETTIGRLLSFANGRSSPERADGLPYPVYGSNGVIGHAAEANADAGAIVIGRVGSYCGSLYLAKKRCWITDNAIRATALDDNAPRYLFYLLGTLSLNSWRAGSGQPLLNQDILSRIPALVPEPFEQRAIAHILGALDDKIDLNRRMNETLEAMARALFRDWFVDFGPTRAKMEGRAPGLPPRLAALFPDRLDEQGKPEGWELSEIGNEVKAVGGATPSTKDPTFWEDGKHHWATPKDLSKLASSVLLDTGRKITDAGVRKISSGVLPVGTVLLSSRAPVGYLAIAEVPTAVNQGFIAMVCRKRLPNVFVLFWCYENLDYIKGISSGSTFAEISKKAFRPIPVIVPSKPVLAAYEGLIRPIYDRIATNTKKSVSLAALRDTLLPKLISGEIRVKDAEKAVA